MPDFPRVDKWLWSVRVFKTRSQATDACHKGHVMMDGLPVKASRTVKPGDVIRVRKSPIYRSYQALEPVSSRVGSREVFRFMEEVTPPEELALLERYKAGEWITRERGAGRPTKKERRDLENYFGLE